MSAQARAHSARTRIETGARGLDELAGGAEREGLIVSHEGREGGDLIEAGENAGVDKLRNCQAGTHTRGPH